MFRQLAPETKKIFTTNLEKIECPVTGTIYYKNMTTSKEGWTPESVMGAKRTEGENKGGE